MRTLKALWADFWDWYQQHYRLNITVAATLFALQLVHLTWLLSEVIWARLFGDPLVHLGGIFRVFIVLVDYTEVPALIGVSLIYVNELRQGFSWKAVLFLFFLNSQWLHLFWITDEFVVGAFGGAGVALPAWLAWVAILIDYAEVPVIIDTFRKMLAARREGRLAGFMRDDL